MEMTHKVGTRVIVKKGNRKGKIVKHIGENVYRIKCDDDFRTVVTDDKFEVAHELRDQ